MDQEHDNIHSNNVFSEGFSKIPHAISNALLILNVTSRERRVIEFILRLTYGCLDHQWARFNLADLQIIGIGKNHAGKVIQGLLERQIILRHNTTKSYKLNEELLISEVPKSGAVRLEKLAGLVGKQLQRKSTQNGNPTVPESGTNGLPNMKLSRPLNGNSDGFPKRELLASPNNHFPESKDKLKIIKESDRKEFANENLIKDNFKVVNPKTYNPSNSHEQAALDAWKELDPFKPWEFSTTYLKAVNKGLPSTNFYQFVSEIKQDPTIQNPGAVFNTKVRAYFESLKERSTI